MVLTCESVDHSNETSSAVLLHGTICFSIFYKIKFGTFFILMFHTLGSINTLSLLRSQPSMPCSPAAWLTAVLSSVIFSMIPIYR